MTYSKYKIDDLVGTRKVLDYTSYSNKPGGVYQLECTLCKGVTSCGSRNMSNVARGSSCPKCTKRGPNNDRYLHQIGEDFGVYKLISTFIKDGTKKYSGYYEAVCSNGHYHKINIVDYSSTKRGNQCALCISYESGYSTVKYRKIYISWLDMHRRCYDVKNKRYVDYGGRGITIYDEWHSWEPFLDWTKLNFPEENMQIDRIDNDGKYEPLNCRWVTPSVNVRNTRHVVKVEIDGVKIPAIDFYEKKPREVGYRHFKNNLKKGMSPEEAVLRRKR